MRNTVVIRSCALLAVVLIVMAIVVHADDDLAALFRYRAEIVSEDGGLCRLLLPPEVLRECRGDLSDLRVVDAAGNELPFVVDGRPPVPAVEVRTLRPQLVAADRQRRDVGRSRFEWLETYQLRLPSRVTEAPAWSLVIATGRTELMTRLDVSLLLPTGATRQLAENVSVFRLTSPTAEQLQIPIGDLEPGTLELRLQTREGGFIEPTFELVSAHSPALAHPATIPLELLDLSHAASHTTATVRRPRGLVPDRLAIRTSTGTYQRQVDIWDAGPAAGDDRLGSGLVFRVASERPVEQTELQLAAPAGDQLQLVIINQDSPPLADLRIEALVHRPHLLISLPEASRSATLLFGGGRAWTPSYDIAAMLPRPGERLTGAAAQRASAVWDPARSNPATLGTIEDNPAWDPEPALAYAWRPGREVESWRFSHVRPLEVTPSDEGLARLRLQPEDLAVAREDLADIRVVDEAGMQWAYLLEAGRAAATLEVGIGDPETSDQRSSMELSPPVTPVKVDRLRLQTDLAFFDRPYRLSAVDDEGQAMTLASGRLRRFQTPTRPLEISFPATRVTKLALEITDGDDAPIPLTSAAVRSPLVDLYIPIEAGSYSLLLGNQEAQAPSYELERIRSVVLAVPSQAVIAGELGLNPNRSGVRKLLGSVPSGTVAVWAALLAALLGLTWLTLRLVRDRAP